MGRSINNFTPFANWIPSSHAMKTSPRGEGFEVNRDLFIQILCLNNKELPSFSRKTKTKRISNNIQWLGRCVSVCVYLWHVYVCIVYERGGKRERMMFDVCNFMWSLNNDSLWFFQPSLLAFILLLYFSFFITFPCLSPRILPPSYSISPLISPVPYYSPL